MKFAIFCEIQRACPWDGADEASLFSEILAQARACDEAGFELWWQVEHHGAPQFSASPSPGMGPTPTAIATRGVRPGPAAVPAPFRIHPPPKAPRRRAPPAL